ncbi:2442_t:CDS:2, partial [Paraglomus occultum]
MTFFDFELISLPRATKACDLPTKIDRIIELIDNASCNGDVLYDMKPYFIEVKNAISDNSLTINEEHVQKLMKALKDWEKFLLRYTKPKMRIFLIKLNNTERIRRKTKKPYDNLNTALKAANIIVTKELIERSRISERRCQDLFTTIGCANGATLSDSDIASLNIKADSVKFESPPDSSNYDAIKIVYHEKTNQDVSAVVIRIGQVGESGIKKKLYKEYQAAYISSKLNTDNDLFAKTYGVLLYEEIYYVVKELPELGTLHEYFEKYNNVCWSKRITMASRLASAVAIFHSKRMLHHNIRSRNVYVDKSHNVKLGNFYHSRKISDVTTSLADEHDHFKWLCPEKLKDSNLEYSMSADVYSFGILMWEISSCKTPFADKTTNEAREMLTKSDGVDARPPIVEGTPEEYQKLMQECWSQDPKRRPSMDSVAKRLKSLEQDYENSNREIPSQYVESAHSSISIQSALVLHRQKNYNAAFTQFKLLADGDETTDLAEAHYRVGLYLIDESIDYHPKDPQTGVQYLKMASTLGSVKALQYLAQYNMLNALKVRKQLRDAGDVEGAERVKQEMKSECLPTFLKGARRG